MRFKDILKVPRVRVDLVRLDETTLSEKDKATSKVQLLVVFWTRFDSFKIASTSVENKEGFVDITLSLKRDKNSKPLEQPIPVLKTAVVEGLNYNTIDRDVALITVKEDVHSKPTGSKSVIIYEDTDLIDTTLAL